MVISESPNTATSGLRRIPSPEERPSLLVLFASEEFGMLRRSWKIFLAGVVIAGALSLPGSAVAGGEICTPTADLDCSSVTNCLQAAASSCRISCCNTTSCGTSKADNACAEPGCAEGRCLDAGHCGGIDIGGWIQEGYHSNAVPNGSAGAGGSFNGHPHRLNLH